MWSVGSAGRVRTEVMGTPGGGFRRLGVGGGFPWLGVGEVGEGRFREEPAPNLLLL